MRKIGPNHGIDATRKFLQSVQDGSIVKTAWQRLFAKIGEADMEATLYKLVEGHNELADMAIEDRLRGLEAKVFGTEPPPPPPPPPPPAKYKAPQTYNKGSSGQDARYCVAGLPVGSDGYRYEPDHPAVRYDNDGLCLGGRTGNPVPGLKASDMMDDKGACDSYEWQGVQFPPWPSQSYES